MGAIKSIIQRLVKGNVIREEYDRSGTLLKKEKMKGSILNPAHWRGWQSFDKNMGGRTRLNQEMDYSVGKKVMRKYTVQKPDGTKVVYKRPDGSKPKLTKETRKYSSNLLR